MQHPCVVDDETFARFEFEANCHGHNHGQEAPATVLNAAMEIVQAGGRVGIPGLYVTEDRAQPPKMPNRAICR